MMALIVSYNLSISYRLLLLLISMIVVSTMTGSSNNNNNLMIGTKVMNHQNYHRQALFTSRSKFYTYHHRRLLFSIIGGSRIRKTSSKENEKGNEKIKNKNNDDIKLNAFKYKNRPLITVKLAISKNGAVDDESGKPYRFTCTDALKAVHRLRRDCDAVLIGINTVLRDDPSLTVRHVKPEMKKSLINAEESGQEEEIEKQPIRIILDNNLRIPNNATVLNDGYQTLIYYNNMSMNMDIKEEMEKKIQHHSNNKNVNFIPIPIRIPIEEEREETKQKIYDYHHPQQQYYTNQLKYLLNDLIHKKNIRHLMIEGGPQIIQNFLSNHFVDRFILIQANSTAFLKKPIFCRFLKFNKQQNDQSNHELEYEFTRYGLNKIKKLKWGEDNVIYFSIPDLPWSSTSYI